MASSFYFDPNLTRSDHLVLQNIVRDIELARRNPTVPLRYEKQNGHSMENGFGGFHDALAVNTCKSSKRSTQCSRAHFYSHTSYISWIFVASLFLCSKFLPLPTNGIYLSHPYALFRGLVVASTHTSIGDDFPHQATCESDPSTVEKLQALNDPLHNDFEPTVFVSWDMWQIKLHPLLNRYFLQPYFEWARKVIRVDTDVVMVTHLILYFTTSFPSAIFLFLRFSWIHGLLHWLMQSYYVGTYTLMMHQHIHMRGILSRKYTWLDRSFPYITDPLMGHTWNSYYYHHVKHHHVEGNGPDDLSSTIRYQRDDFIHFAQYVGRFFFLVWIDLPRYFFRKGRYIDGLNIATSELANYTAIYLLAVYVNLQATIFVFILPFILLRLGLMVGNWGQHAFVDETEPESDFRSSITLIDVAVSKIFLLRLLCPLSSTN